mmetsp:Transcript_1402/g.3086  ORF Transcript_1402/g.3086 Transcript_1402/m.3086 type:complete len:274 (-) Transcript_1402:460-1281(-)
MVQVLSRLLKDALHMRVVDSLHAGGGVRRNRDRWILQPQPGVLLHQLDQLGDCDVLMHMDLDRLSSTHGAVILPLVRERVGVDGVTPLIHHVVSAALRAHMPRHSRRKLQNFVGAGGSDDGVGGSDGWDDPLCHPLCELERHSLNPKLLRSLQRRLVEPLHVLGVVALQVSVIPKGPHPVPLQLLRPLHAVCGGSRDIRKGAHGEVDLGREEREDALEAGSDERVDHVDVPCETLSAPVDHRNVASRLDVALVVKLGETAHHIVHPSPRLQRV